MLSAMKPLSCDPARIEGMSERLIIRRAKGLSMRLLLASGIAMLVTCGVAESVRAAASNACKQCSDHRKRCIANYPGPTCKVDYDICMKNCRSK